jgi:hypothetical protein
MSFWTKTSRRNNGKQQCLAAATTFFIPPARFPRNWSVINRFISTNPEAEDMSDKDSLGSFTPASFSTISTTPCTGPSRLGSPLSTIASVLSADFQMLPWGLKAVDMAKRKNAPGSDLGIQALTVRSVVP